jgi:hypothetical protein
MDVNDRGPLLSARRLGPPAWYRSDRRGVKGYPLWYRNPFHDVVEATASSSSFELAFHGRDNRSQSGHRDRIFLANRMYN